MKAHREVDTGKPDPYSIDMTDFRMAVTRVLADRASTLPNWTAELFDKLPTLQPGAEHLHVKTRRDLLRARGYEPADMWSTTYGKDAADLEDLTAKVNASRPPTSSPARRVGREPLDGCPRLDAAPNKQPRPQPERCLDGRYLGVPIPRNRVIANRQGEHDSDDEQAHPRNHTAGGQRSDRANTDLLPVPVHGRSEACHAGDRLMLIRP
ncbi:hypothetical protein [Nonomuraea sp. KM90]|uniref:hypothetical protein n=1 Tax=Nonomuraea sp. KM90 TaxID=3457428 RepID=UPI003FCCC897